MSIGILGRKVGMTRLFGEGGVAIPVTVIEAGPCYIVQVKSKEKDGYEAIQLGFGQKRESVLNKPTRERFKKANCPPLRTLKEFKVDDIGKYKTGEKISADIFELGEKVDIVGISKGKGFAGVVKRWGFKGGKATHGAETHRASGSIGASSDPSRVFKNMPMAGRMGGGRVTIQNLKILKVDAERNILVVEGSIPGPTNGFVMIKKAVKA